MAIFCFRGINMNEKTNKFLLAEDKFMPEVHLRQPRFTYSACESFSKNKEQIQKFKETGDLKYIYWNVPRQEFLSTWAYRDLKSLLRRKISDKAFNIMW